MEEFPLLKRALPPNGTFRLNFNLFCSLPSLAHNARKFCFVTNTLDNSVAASEKRPHRIDLFLILLSYGPYSFSKTFGTSHLFYPSQKNPLLTNPRSFFLLLS